VIAVAPPLMPPVLTHGYLSGVRAWRLRYGLSQRQLAKKMKVPRSYVSKIECHRVTCTLYSLERLARALNVAIPDLLSPGECRRKEEVDALLNNVFIRQLLPHVSQLTSAEMSSILVQVSDLAAQRRRLAWSTRS
jgi:transcriptional regulator with XRE-family HTH domain